MTRSDPPTPLYARTKDVIGTDVDGEVVLLDPASWTYFGFDNIGSAIWALLETPHSLPSLVEALTERFDVDEQRCLSDARAFIDSLATHGLITVADA